MYILIRVLTMYLFLIEILFNLSCLFHELLEQMNVNKILDKMMKKNYIKDKYWRLKSGRNRKNSIRLFKR